ncbi:hypothetical protein [Sphaerothrix gracilis]|uniref:hypothetical protein n=1 Tax=Sphaerothrix gracilis TaxID=3151835 RepID=UPI0031FDCA12
MNWILVSGPDEASASSEYWTGASWSASVNEAEVFSEAEGNNIESVRAIKGAQQGAFTDRDVRIAEVTVAVTITSELS